MEYSRFEELMLEGWDIRPTERKVMKERVHVLYATLGGERITSDTARQLRVAFCEGFRLRDDLSEHYGKVPELSSLVE